MSTQVVLTVVGPDRPGLVSALADVVAERGGSWLTSELAQLAGHFAGIVLVELPADNVSALEESVRRLDADGLLEVGVNVTGSAPAVVETGSGLTLRLLGQDHPGIVRDISSVLADQGVTIREFSSHIQEAPQAGGSLFEATVSAVVPPETDADALRVALEALAAELMVDLEFDEA